MNNVIKHLYQLSRTLHEIQIYTDTNPIKLSSVDIEFDYNDYNQFMFELNSSPKSFEFKNIQPGTNIHHGRTRGYTRVMLDGFTFNVYIKREEYETVQKIRKPHSRFY